MRIGYLDCFSGISGDMCLGALVGAGVPLATIRDALATLPLSGYTLSSSRLTRRGLAATKVDVELDESQWHPHRGLSDVLTIIRSGDLSARAVERSCAVFRVLAEAEAHVHGCGVDEVHFHEVGAVDAICDVVGTVVGIEALGLDDLLFSRVSLGGGTVKCAHGLLPVPAPATAELLKGLPTAGGPVDVELTTPTGAAILKALARPVPGWPAMTGTVTAYGAGGRDLMGVSNVLRLIVGEGDGEAAAEAGWVCVLETNVDDATGEEVGHCLERLMAGGALDAFVTPVQMKKGRPGLLLTVLCGAEQVEEMERTVFRHTSTFGVRRSVRQRSMLRREVRTVGTPWGDVRVKVGFLAGEEMRCEPEYEDCRALAETAGVSLREVHRAALSSYASSSARRP